MDSITGWASKMFMKQKMGNLTENLPGQGGDEDTGPSKKVTKARDDIAARKAEREAEYEAKRAERAAKKGSMADRWAKNKASNK